MTKEEKKRIIEIYGKDFREIDIPTYIRNRDKKVAEHLNWTFMQLARAFDIPKEYAKKYNPFRNKK